MQAQVQRPSKSSDELLSGFAAGLVSTAVCHPLDLVKVRLQVHKRSSFRATESVRLLHAVWRAENGIRGLYRGLLPNIAGSSSSWGLYFLLYERFKSSIPFSRGGNNLTGNSGLYFLSSFLAGLCVAIVTNPIWVIKTRMLSTGSNHVHAYPSMTYGLKSILASEGLRGLYRGLLPSMVGISQGAFQFGAYEHLKRFGLPGLRPDEESLSIVQLISYSCLAKLFATSLTYPYQVVRSRLQVHDASSGPRQVRAIVSELWSEHRVLAFYRGFWTNAFRVFPSTCITFIVYERMRTLLAHRQEVKPMV